jgi:adenylate cyclase class IV
MSYIEDETIIEDAESEKKQIHSQELDEFLSDLGLSEEEIEAMTYNQKVDVADSYRQAEDDAYDTFIASRGQY